MINSICNRTVFVLFIFFSTLAGAEAGPDHDSANKEEHHNEEVEKGHDHDQKESHGESDEEHKEADADHDEHGHEEDGDHEEGGAHEEEGGAKVGPDKGITEKGENGFKLSKEATAAFNLKFGIASDLAMELPKSTIVHIKNGKFVYRVRDGWIQRIPINVVFQSESGVKIQSSELNGNDKIVTFGTGFIRGAELILLEGATHSH